MVGSPFSDPPLGDSDRVCLSSVLSISAGYVGINTASIVRAPTPLAPGGALATNKSVSVSLVSQAIPSVPGIETKPGYNILESHCYTAESYTARQLLMHM